MHHPRKLTIRRCDGVSRRDMLRVGSLTGFGLSLLSGARPASAGSSATAKSCILLWLDGGPSHLETYDVKPDAPAEVRGPFRPVATNVPGIQISELLEHSARMADKFAIIRSMTSPLGEHGLANQYLLTGYKPTSVLEYPSYGSVVTHLRGGDSTLPPYVTIPDFRPASGAGFLGTAFQPFAVGGDPAKPDFRVSDLDFYPGIDANRLADRRAIVAQLERFQDSVDSVRPCDSRFEAALRLVTSEQAKQAFDLTQERPEVRARYGPRTLGQSCLLARRLVERGVSFVTVNHAGWDTHDNVVLRLKEGFTGAKVGVGLVPTFDLAFSALIEDLDLRGLLSETLVIAMGEFGRTPKLNTAGGRDHWPRVFSIAIAGGGVRGGQVIGSSDAIGESPRDRPVTPADLAHTIYDLLGVDPSRELHTTDGRPVQINQGGQLVRELLS